VGSGGQMMPRGEFSIRAQARIVVEAGVAFVVDMPFHMAP